MIFCKPYATRAIYPCAAILWAWAAVLASADAVSLEATYPDGRSEMIPLVSVDGLDCVSLPNLAEMIRRIDAGMTMEPQYRPPSLRIVAAGRNIAIQSDRGGEAFIVIDGRIRRPRYALRVVDGEMLIPLETLRTINDSCGFFAIRESAATERTPEATPSETPPEAGDLLPPSVAPTPRSGEATPALPTPRPDIVKTQAMPEVAESALPPLFSSAVDTPPPLNLEQTPQPFSPGQWRQLMRPAETSRFYAIAVASMTPALPFDEAMEIWAGARAAECANRLASALTATGRFQVERSERAIDSSSMDQTIDWANRRQVDALIVLTVDGVKLGQPSGARIYAPHGMGDARARPRTRAVGGGLPKSMNYLPYQNMSLQLAEAIHRRLGDAIAVPTMPVQTAPLFALRRVSAASTLISLGFATTADDRVFLEDDDYLDTAVGAMVDALLSLQAASAPTEDATWEMEAAR